MMYGSQGETTGVAACRGTGRKQRSGTHPPRFSDPPLSEPSPQMGSKDFLRVPVRARTRTSRAARGESPTRALEEALIRTAGPTRGARQPDCPHCQSERISRWGAAHGIPRYRCSSCKRTFNILTNTPLARLRNRQRWLTFVGTMVEKKSVRKSAAACGISVTTSSRWRRRFLECSPAERARILREIIVAVSNASALTAATGGVGSTDMAWAKDLLPAILSWLV